MKKVINIFILAFTSLIISLIVITQWQDFNVKAQNSNNDGTVVRFAKYWQALIAGCAPYYPGEVAQYSAGGQWTYKDPDPCLSNDPNTRVEYMRENSAVGGVMNITEELYTNQPSSAFAWFNHEFNKIQGNDYAFAQDPTTTSFYRPGLGFTILTPLRGLWAWSRNLTYILFIILVIIIAFMILFRRSFEGQNPVTIFNSIPSIIVSLILITFSYPLSGFFIDIVTLGTTLSQSVILSSPGAPGYSNVWNYDPTTRSDANKWDANIYRGSEYENRNFDLNEPRKFLQPDDYTISVWQILDTTDVRLCDEEATGEACNLENLLPSNIGVSNILGQIVETIVMGSQTIGASNTLVSLIIGFAGFSVSIKLFMTLLNKYIRLTVGVILSPWYFFISALPGKSESTISMFIRVHLGAALSFVGLYAYFLLMIVISQTLQINSLNWIPPLMGYTVGGVDSESTGVIIRSVIVFGLFLGAPTIPEFIDKLLQVPETNRFTQEIGQRLSSGAGTLRGAAGFAGQMVLPGSIGRLIGGR